MGVEEELGAAAKMGLSSAERAKTRSGAAWLTSTSPASDWTAVDLPLLPLLAALSSNALPPACECAVS